MAAAVPPGAICRWQRIDIRERRKMCRKAARACECVDSFEGAMAREREQKKKERKKRDGGVRGEGVVPGVAAHPAAGTSTVSEQR